MNPGKPKSSGLIGPKLDNFYLLTPKAFEILEEKTSGFSAASLYPPGTILTYSYYSITGPTDYQSVAQSTSTIPESSTKNLLFISQFKYLCDELAKLVDVFVDEKVYITTNKFKDDDITASQQKKIIDQFRTKVDLFYEGKPSAKQKLSALYKFQLEQALVALSTRKLALEDLSKDKKNSRQYQEYRSEIVSNLIMLCQGLAQCSEGSKSSLDAIVRNLMPSTSLVSARQKFRYHSARKVADDAARVLNVGTVNLHAPTIFIEYFSTQTNLGFRSATSHTTSEYKNSSGEIKLRDHAQSKGRDALAAEYNFETICEHVAQEKYHQLQSLLEKYKYPITFSASDKERWLQATQFLQDAKICNVQDLITQVDKNHSMIPLHFFEQVHYYLRRWSLQAQLDEGAFHPIAKLPYKRQDDGDITLADITARWDLNQLITREQQTLLTEPLLKGHFYRFVVTLEFTGCNPNIKNKEDHSPLTLALSSESPSSSETQFFVVNTLLKLPALPRRLSISNHHPEYWCDLTSRDPQGHSLLTLASIKNCGYDSFELLFRHIEHTILVLTLEELLNPAESKSLTQETKGKDQPDTLPPTLPEDFKEYLEEKLAESTDLFSFELLDNIRDGFFIDKALETKQKHEISTQLNLIKANARKNQAALVQPSGEPHQALYYAVAEFDLSKTIRLLQIPGWKLDDIDTLIMQQSAESMDTDLKSTTHQPKKSFNPKNKAHQTISNLMYLLIELARKKTISDRSFELYEQIKQDLSAIPDILPNALVQLIKAISTQVDGPLFTLFFQEAKLTDLAEIIIVQDYLQQLPKPATLGWEGSDSEGEVSSHLAQAITGVLNNKYPITMVKKLIDYQLVTHPKHFLSGLLLMIQLFKKDKMHIPIDLPLLLLPHVEKTSGHYCTLLTNAMHAGCANPILEALIDYFSDTPLLTSDAGDLLFHVIACSKLEVLLKLLKKRNFVLAINFNDTKIKDKLAICDFLIKHFSNGIVIKYYLDLIRHLSQPSSKPFTFSLLQEFSCDEKSSDPVTAALPTSAVTQGDKESKEPESKQKIKPEKQSPAEEKTVATGSSAQLQHCRHTFEIIQAQTENHSAERAQWIQLLAQQVFDLNFLIDLAPDIGKWIDLTQPRMLWLSGSAPQKRLPVLTAIELENADLVSKLLAQIGKFNHKQLNEVIALGLYRIITAGEDIFSTKPIDQPQIVFSDIMLEVGVDQNQIGEILLRPIGQLITIHINLISSTDRNLNLLSLMINYLPKCSSSVFNHAWGTLQEWFEKPDNDWDLDEKFTEKPSDLLSFSPSPPWQKKGPRSAASKLTSVLMDPSQPNFSLYTNIHNKYISGDQNTKRLVKDILRFLLTQFKFLDNSLIITVPDEKKKSSTYSSFFTALEQAIQNGAWNYAYIFFLGFVAYSPSYRYATWDHKDKVDDQIIKLENFFTAESTAILSEFTAIVSRQQPKLLSNFITWLKDMKTNAGALIQVTQFSKTTLLDFDKSIPMLNKLGSEILVFLRSKFLNRKQQLESDQYPFLIKSIALTLETLNFFWRSLELSSAEIFKLFRPLSEVISETLYQDLYEWGEDTSSPSVIENKLVAIFELITVSLLKIDAFSSEKEALMIDLLTDYFQYIDNAPYLILKDPERLKSRIIAIAHSCDLIISKNMIRCATKRFDLNLIKAVQGSRHRFQWSEQDSQPHPLFLLAETKSEIRALPLIDCFLDSTPKIWPQDPDEAEMIADFKARGWLNQSKKSLLIIFIEKNWMTAAHRLITAIPRIYPDSFIARQQYIDFQVQQYGVYLFVNNMMRDEWSTDTNLTFFELLQVKILSPNDLFLLKTHCNKRFPVPYALFQLINYWHQDFPQDPFPLFAEIMQNFLKISLPEEEALSKLIDLIQFNFIRGLLFLPHRNLFLSWLLKRQIENNKQNPMQCPIVQRLIETIEHKSLTAAGFHYMSGTSIKTHPNLIQYAIASNSPKVLNVALAKAKKNSEAKSSTDVPVFSEVWVNQIFLAHTDTQLEFIRVFCNHQPNRSFTIEQIMVLIEKALINNVSLPVFLEILDYLVKNNSDTETKAEDTERTNIDIQGKKLLALQELAKNLYQVTITSDNKIKLTLLQISRVRNFHLSDKDLLDLIYALPNSKELLQIFNFYQKLLPSQDYQQLINQLFSAETETPHLLQPSGIQIQVALLERLFNDLDKHPELSSLIKYMISSTCSLESMQSIFQWKLKIENTGDEKKSDGIKRELTVQEIWLPSSNYPALYQFAQYFNDNLGAIDNPQSLLKVNFLLKQPGLNKNQEVKGKTAVEIAHKKMRDLLIDDIDICHYELEKFFGNFNAVQPALIFEILTHIFRKQIGYLIVLDEKLMFNFQDPTKKPLEMPEGLVWVNFYQEFSKWHIASPVITSEISKRKLYNPIHLFSRRNVTSSSRRERKREIQEKKYRPAMPLEDQPLNNERTADWHSTIDTVELQAISPYYIGSFFNPKRESSPKTLKSLSTRLARLKSKVSIDCYLSLKINIIGETKGDHRSKFWCKDALLNELTDAYRSKTLNIRQYLNLLKAFSTRILPTEQKHEIQEYPLSAETANKNLIICSFSRYVVENFNRFPPPRTLRFLGHSPRTRNPHGIEHFPTINLQNLQNYDISGIKCHVLTRLAAKLSSLGRDEITQDFYEILYFLTDKNYEKSEKMVTAIVDSYIARYQVVANDNHPAPAHRA